jgi:uncharacterized cupin superfamily protein
LASNTFNLFHGETQNVPAGAPGDRGRAARVGRMIGAARLGMSVYELPPGEAIGPYHFEWTDEEWLIALAGTVSFRGPDGEQTLELGDVVCFPAGPDGAHQVRNTGDDTARLAIVSSMNEFGIVEYPEEEKVGIWAGKEQFTLDRPSGQERSR